MLTTLDQCAFFAHFDDVFKQPTAFLTLGVDINSDSDSFPSQDTSKTTPRPHACHFDGCGKSFRRRSTLKEHLRTHTGEKMFHCTVASCQRRFTTSGNLWRHKRAQHPWLDAPLECLVDDCGCTFSSEAKLERHMAMVHFSASSHSCGVKRCGRAFSTAGNLRRHMKQHHDVVHDVTEATHVERSSKSPSAVADLALEPTNAVRWASSTFHTPMPGCSDGELIDILATLLD